MKVYTCNIICICFRLFYTVSGATTCVMCSGGDHYSDKNEYIPVDHKYTAERLVSDIMLHGRFNSMRAATHNS